AIHLLAALAIAHAQGARAGPAVGEERVHGIALPDLPVDGRHLLGEIRREHAGLEEPGGFGVAAGLAVAVALEPSPVRPQRLPPGVVAVHARYHPDAPRARRLVRPRKGPGIPVDSCGIPYRASGSGRSWNLSTLLVVPFPPSM